VNEVDVLGVQVNAVTFDEAVAEIVRMVDANERGYVVTPTVDHMVKLRSDPEFREVYENASLVVADGMPIVWAARFLGRPLPARVCGSDLLPALCEQAARRGWRVFFLGAMPGVARKAAGVLRTTHPSIDIAGTYSPPFGFENDEAETIKILNKIREADPHILFVGLGAPKQEKWMYRHRHEHGARVALGIGIAFDFVAGTQRRAPLWLQNIGFEWLWRVLREPARLWKRYLVNDPVFFWWVLRERLRLPKNRSGA
jgi:N-acetylglucosaminyldiphosphoundecaprenol N-acetyl-beta-D-mannosaminyltransferase